MITSYVCYQVKEIIETFKALLKVMPAAKFSESLITLIIESNYKDDEYFDVGPITFHKLKELTFSGWSSKICWNYELIHDNNFS
jgi:hypothetical protein